MTRRSERNLVVVDADRVDNQRLVAVRSCAATSYTDMGRDSSPIHARSCDILTPRQTLDGNSSRDGAKPGRQALPMVESQVGEGGGSDET